MNCCSDCFSDNELKGFIYSNSNSNEQCDFCEKEGAPIVNTQELQEQFILLLELYSIDKNGLDIVSAIQKDWNIFNIEDTKKSKELLLKIVEGLDEQYTELFDNKISISINSEESNLLIDTWNKFKDEIKKENRFFNKNSIDLESIKRTFPVRPYSKGKIFYRSRISTDENGYSIDKMGKPPHKNAKSGRANPTGISYLYVSQSIETTLYEARATFLDFVSIGEFKLLENIKVISLRPSFQISPFVEGYSIEEYLKNKPFIDLLEKELSKPLRRHDNELDYLSTQYLCEYIKHLGYDGVEFGSSLHEKGINIVFFDDVKLECISVKIYEVTKIEIESREVEK
ncbi:RES domain-containing protein [Flavobacteriaceae bacterium LMO-SS05]